MLAQRVEMPKTTVVQLRGADRTAAQVAPLAAGQEIIGELDSQTGILYNSDGTQVQLPPGTEFKTVMTPGGQVCVSALRHSASVTV